MTKVMARKPVATSTPTATPNREAAPSNLHPDESELTPPPPPSNLAVGGGTQVELMAQTVDVEGRPTLLLDCETQRQNSGVRRQDMGGKRLPRNDGEIQDENQQDGHEVRHGDEAEDEQIGADGDNGDANQQDGPGNAQNDASGGKDDANHVEDGLRRSSRIQMKNQQTRGESENVDEGPSKHGAKKKAPGKTSGSTKKAANQATQKKRTKPKVLAVVEVDDDSGGEDGGLADAVDDVLGRTINWLSAGADIARQLQDNRAAFANALKRRGSGGGGPGVKRSK